MFGGAHTVDSLLNDLELTIEKPPMGVCDTAAAIFNSLVKDNVEQKVEEMRSIIQPQYFPWLAYYLVKSRASKEVNFHATYIEFFEKLQLQDLFDMVTSLTYDCLRVLLKSVDQAVVSTSHRTVLKNLGYWLGQITLARNKSLKSKQLDLKNALLDAYENGRLTAVLPLVCKVLEGVQKSKAYQLPNPWTTVMMSLLAEIHDVPNLRTNLMFEVEVLCKHLDIKISDLKRSDLLAGKRPPPGSNDLSNAARQALPEAKPDLRTSIFSPLSGLMGAKPGEEASGALRAAAATGGHQLFCGDAACWLQGAETAREDDAQRAAAVGGYHAYAPPRDPLLAHPPGEFIIPTLPSLVTINHSIPLFKLQPSIRALVPHAVDRAIKEVISAVVERSVTISCLTTREMVTKDFAMEPDENMLKKAAQLMVSSVAGALALVTCREPLRVSLTNHVWNLLAPPCQAMEMTDTAALEQVVHILSTDNLELGCSLIEKAVVDKALKDIEVSIAPALQARKEHRARNSNVHYYDASYVQAASKWPQSLPDMLRPKPGPVSAQQLKVYKDFNSLPTGTARARLPASLPPLNMAGVTAAPAAAPTAPLQEPLPFLPAQGLQPGAGGFFLGLSHGHGQPDGPSPGLGPDPDLSSEAGGPPVDDVRAAWAELPAEPQAALAAAVGATEQAIQGILENPPLLPPIDPSDLQLYRQDDALEACAALALLPLNHELVNLLRRVPHWLAHCGHPDTCAMDFARCIFKRLYEAPQSVPQVHPPDTVSRFHVTMEVYLSVLDMAREPLKEQLVKVLTAWVSDVSGVQRYDVDVLSGLLRYRLVGSSEFDRILAKWIDSRPREAQTAINAPAMDFAVMLLQRVCLRQRVLSGADFPQTVEALLRECARTRSQQLQLPSPVSPQEAQLADSASKVIEELRAGEPPPAASASRQTLSVRLAERLEEEQRRRAAGLEAVGSRNRKAMLAIFEEWQWHNLHDASPDGVQGHAGHGGGHTHTRVLQQITSAGFARTEEGMERFFRVCCKHAASAKHAGAPQSGAEEEEALGDRGNAEPGQADAHGDQAPAPMSFAAVDSFTRLIVLLMKSDDKVQMLTRALSAISQELLRECEKKGSEFNQRPYFRMLLNLLMDVSAPDPQFEQANVQLLSTFCNTFHTCNPRRAPNFAFAWLELISNRMFMPKLLTIKGQRGWPMFQRLLVQLLYFLEPYLRRVQLNDSTRLLYKGTVRTLLVLLHDFPEFLCDYHFSFCDLMPIPCVQIRNLILSAFPRNMKLPDPFMPNLKVDLLPEVKVAPRILANYTTTLLQLHLKADVDLYMRTREKRLLETMKEKLRLPKRESLQLDTKYNVPLLNALLLYVGVHLSQHGKTLPGQGSLQQNNPSLDIFAYLAHNLDFEGRYLFLGAIANHLRYPNAHTHYFSCVMLYLFADTCDPVVREQITRVLLERLIVHRPHPWGLLITFIELIKNRRYEFWNHGFVKCAPEVEKLFQSVAFTCLGTTIDRQSEGEQPRAKPGAGGNGGGSANGASAAAGDGATGPSARPLAGEASAGGS